MIDVRLEDERICISAIHDTYIRLLVRYFISERLQMHSKYHLCKSCVESTATNILLRRFLINVNGGRKIENQVTVGVNVQKLNTPVKGLNIYLDSA